MNDSTIKELANEQMPVNTAIRGFINSINYINIGVITKVHDENYVDVNLYYTSSSGKKCLVQAVRLLHIGTTKCKINIVPAVGDNVLLLCPKDFIETIEYNRKPQQNDRCYLPYGNINMCGILIKDESDDNVKTTININENGDIAIETEGKTSVETKDNISFTTEGDVSVDSDKTITFDGDKFGGLCKTPELKKQLDILTGRVDSIINGIKTATVTPEDGGATFKSGIIASIEAYTQKEDFSQIESDKVKHGDGSSS